jgi:hypothetical protein
VLELQPELSPFRWRAAANANERLFEIASRIDSAGRRCRSRLRASNRPRLCSARVAYVYASLWLAGGVLALGLARYLSRRIREERHWPAVPGKILERGLGGSVGTGHSYMPRVKYEYSVSGTQHVNDQVYLVRRTGGVAPAMRRLVERLPDPVPVHHDPAEPAAPIWSPPRGGWSGFSSASAARARARSRTAPRRLTRREGWPTLLGFSCCVPELRACVRGPRT